MLAYAAHKRRIAQRRSAPHAMLLIVAGHIAVIAAVMSARMEMPDRLFPPPTEVDLIKLPPPPPKHSQPDTPPKSSPATVDRVSVIVPIPQPGDDQLDPTPILSLPNAGTIGPAVDIRPAVRPVETVRVGPRFATPPSAVRPPYPPSKIASEEEAVLRLRLSIDERGRVVAVEPVGRADRAFLEAARRHLTARWRYKPATEDGRALASTTVITLRFELTE